MPLGDLAILVDIVRKRNQAKLDKAEQEERKKREKRKGYSRINNPYLRSRFKTINKENPEPPKAPDLSKEELADVEDTLTGF